MLVSLRFEAGPNSIRDFRAERVMKPAMTCSHTKHDILALENRLSGIQSTKCRTIANDKPEPFETFAVGDAPESSVFSLRIHNLKVGGVSRPTQMIILNVF
jgi:hypothetical protein